MSVFWLSIMPSVCAVDVVKKGKDRRYPVVRMMASTSSSIAVVAFEFSCTWTWYPFS